MSKIEDKNITGFTLRTTKEKLIIEMPIKNLVNGFNLSPQNYCEAKVKRGMRKEFAQWIAENLLDEADSETGDNFIVTMLDQLFVRAYEGAEDFVKYSDEEK